MTKKILLVASYRSCGAIEPVAAYLPSDAIRADAAAEILRTTKRKDFDVISVDLLTPTEVADRSSLLNVLRYADDATQDAGIRKWRIRVEEREADE